MACRAGCACCWVAELVDGEDVKAIEKVEAVGDEVEVQTLGDGNRLGDAEIDLEESRSGEGVAAEIAVATGRRSHTGNGEDGAVRWRQPRR